MATTEFMRTLRTYAENSKRAGAEIINRKAYFTALGAIKKTRVTDKKDIAAFFKNPKRYAKVVMKAFGLKGNVDDGTLKQYAKKLKGMRNRSVAYLRSGWIPAIKTFGKMARQKRSVKGVRQHGRAKGNARRAKYGAKASASMTNRTGHKVGQITAAKRYAEPALKRAIGDEQRSMIRHMEKKMKETARKSGIRVM